MWIIPNNFPLASRFATELEDLTKDLSELSESFATSALWRSKPYSPRTWSRRWKRVKWIRVLFGRTLKRSQHTFFETALIGYLEGIPVRRSVLPASERGPKTLDTFGRILNESSKQCDLFAASSRTSTITLHSDFHKFMNLYREWVTSLRLEYSQRKKLAHHTRGSECSSLPWTTPTAVNRTRSDESLNKIGILRKENAGQNTVPLYLEEQVKRGIVKWPTVTINGNHNRKGSSPKAGNGLSTEVKNWPTPKAQNANSPGIHGTGGLDLQTTVNGHQDPESLNRHGNPRAQFPDRLNAAWVCELMGTIFEKTFFVHLETQ